MIEKVIANTDPDYTQQPTATILVGTNDADFCRASIGCQNNYKYSLQASLGWLTVPKANKFVASTFTQTGTWTPNESVGGGTSLYTNVNGSTLSHSIQTNGGALQVSWGASDTAGGSATVSIDGTVVDTLTSGGFNGQTIATRNGTPALFSEDIPRRGWHSRCCGYNYHNQLF